MRSTSDPSFLVRDRPGSTGSHPLYATQMKEAPLLISLALSLLDCLCLEESPTFVTPIHSAKEAEVGLKR